MASSTAEDIPLQSDPGNQEPQKTRKKRNRNRNKSHSNAALESIEQTQNTGQEVELGPKSPPQPQNLAPSVKQLFDSVQEPVSLQITVIGDRREVNPISSQASGPVSQPKQHQKKNTKSHPEQPAGSNPTSQPPGDLNESVSLKSSVSGEQIEQKKKKPRKPKSAKRKDQGAGPGANLEQGDGVAPTPVVVTSSAPQLHPSGPENSEKVSSDNGRPSSGKPNGSKKKNAKATINKEVNEKTNPKPGQSECTPPPPAETSLDHPPAVSLTGPAKQQTTEGVTTSIAVQKASEQKAPAQKASAQKAPKQKAPAQNASDQKASEQKAPTQKASAQKAPAQKASEQKAPTQKASVQKAPAEQASEQKAPTQKASEQKAPAQKAPAQKASEQKAPAQKAPEKKAPEQKAPEQQTVAPKAAVPKTEVSAPANSFVHFVEDYRRQVGQKYITQLEADKIKPLTKRSSKFPKAHFYCQLCEFHMETAEVMEQHRTTDEAHLRRKRIKTGDSLLLSIPTQTSNHLTALSDYLDKVYAEIQLTDEQVAARKLTVDKLEGDLHEHCPALSNTRLQVCGSVRSGFAMKDSDTNIRIIASKTANLAEVMISIYDVLVKLDKTYRNVKKDYSVRSPFVNFTVEGVSGTFCLQFSEEGNQISNMIVSVYAKFDRKLQHLGILFKHMAKLGHIADSGKGALPSYCYPLLAIFYCQQQHLLPILFKNSDLEVKAEAEVQGEIDNLPPAPTRTQLEAKSIGQLWLGMLYYYSLEFKVEAHLVSILSYRLMSKQARAWGTRRLAIEDPGIPKRNLCKAVSHQRVFDFISDQLRRTYKYFSIPQTASGPAYTMLEVTDSTGKTSKEMISKSATQLQTTNESKPATDASKDIADELENLDLNNSGTGADISVTQGLAVEAEDSSEETNPNVDEPDDESDRDKAVESVGMSSSSAVTDTGISDGTDTATNTPAGMASEKKFSLPSAAARETANSQILDAVSAHISKAVSGEVAKTVSAQIAKTVSNKVVKASQVANTATDKSEIARETSAESEMPSSKSPSIKEELLYNKEKVAQMAVADFFFDFNSKHFGLVKQQLPIFCRQCAKPNHTVENCPEERLPPCVPLPPPSSEHHQILSKLLIDIKEQNELLPQDNAVREEYLDELLYTIQGIYGDAQLTLYGSSRNGFGTCRSDLDICMTFEHGTQPSCAEDTRRIIKRVAQSLCSISHLTNINPLLHAKVPIVKFYSQRFKLEADLSLYNILAQRNTQMLRRYSEIDGRVRTLGYCAKEFAKNCDIGDASKGSLSSYTYIIMMIYYLQQCEPPVLPVLQQLYNGETSPEFVVDDWNTWFYSEDNEHLKGAWEGYGKNDSHVSHLWLGFLDFYAQRFEFKTHVVSIRQHQKMSKFEKLWNSDTLAVEDPFDLKRNLGGALSKRMNAYILSTFVKARTAFHSPAEKLNAMPEGKRPTTYDYFFRHKDLPSGGGERPPDSGRNCRICKQIGHYAQACPVKVAQTDRRRKLKEMREAERRKAEREEREMERRLSESDGQYSQVRWSRGNQSFGGKNRNNQSHYNRSGGNQSNDNRHHSTQSYPNSYGNTAGNHYQSGHTNIPYHKGYNAAYPNQQQPRAARQHIQGSNQGSQRGGSSVYTSRGRGRSAQAGQVRGQQLPASLAFPNIPPNFQPVMPQQQYLGYPVAAAVSGNYNVPHPQNHNYNQQNLSARKN